MPPAASKLLTPQQLVPEPTGWALWECVIIGTKDARTVDQSFQNAGFQRSDHEPPDAINIIKETQVLHYVFDVPSDAGQTSTVEADVMFNPFSPHAADVGDRASIHGPPDAPPGQGR